jgi:hypothetical protein
MLGTATLAKTLMFPQSEKYAVSRSGEYARDGEIKIGDTALDSPSKREIARQERMKREG